MIGGLVFTATVLAEELPAGDPVEGRAIASACRACHGPDGYARVANAPHIGGEDAAYIANQMIAYRDGTRRHAAMSLVARRLDNQAIADVAAWYASHRVSTRMTRPAPEAPEQCTACHGADGIATIRNAPHIAGEASVYIATQLKAYKSGKRVNAVMSDIAAMLTDDEIRSIANWYSAVDLTIESPGN